LSSSLINGVPKVVENGTMLALFADDTKVYRTIKSVSDCNQLQQALTNLDVWSIDNNITINALKCKVLSVTRNKTPNFLCLLPRFGTVAES
jgi:hypothetical protein